MYCIFCESSSMYWQILDLIELPTSLTAKRFDCSSPMNVFGRFLVNYLVLDRQLVEHGVFDWKWVCSTPKWARVQTLCAQACIRYNRTPLHRILNLPLGLLEDSGGTMDIVRQSRFQSKKTPVSIYIQLQYIVISSAMKSEIRLQASACTNSYY